MIDMQRSLSSPIPIHSSPPISPTVTHVTSRSPTPSPDSHVELEVPRRFKPRTPVRPSQRPMRNDMSLPLRRSDDIPRRPTAIHAPSSIITQAVALASPAAPKITDGNNQGTSGLPDAPPPATSPSKLPLPLLDDVSLYSNPQVIPDEIDSTSLEELAHVVRLSKYQERKCANTRVRLQRSLISTALSARLTRCGEIALRNLADCFRGDEKGTFASLYDAIHNVRNSCDELRKYAVLEPEMEALHSPSIGSSENLDSAASSRSRLSPPMSSTPFLNDVSAEARETFLTFLTQLRNNPDYLATRLSLLNTTELSKLMASHQYLEPVNSVLPFGSQTFARTGSTSKSQDYASTAKERLLSFQRQNPSGSSNRNLDHSPDVIGRLLSFQRHDPLSALIHTCFANSAGPDSAEDMRRTEIWATACARLIREKRGDSILIPVLNAWTAMRDWSGRSNMEWYLMKILEDGAFLLERAEDQHGTRFNLSDWTQKDQIAAEEFYDRATNELFEIIDDEDATGIPEGLLELGNQIIRKLDDRLADTVRNTLVSKWLFPVWVMGVVIHPEAYGLMADYHITEYGRQKILKTVATRAHNLVSDMTSSLGNSSINPVSTPPKIKAHIGNILNRFRGSRSARKTAKLLPARSITSLRETTEVHPYLVVSPADLVTLVNALFPERRPQSAHSSGIRSGGTSISGFSAISQPISMARPRNYPDTASVISTSASSVVSEATTSREPLLEGQRTGTSSRYSPPLRDEATQKRMSNYEDDGYRLRLAAHDMVHALGIDAIKGSCHPCAERWAVLFISPDGNNLSTQMKYDPDEDPDEEENSSTSDTDDEVEDDRPELDKDYHQLRDSILKLVEDFEIPHNSENNGSKAHTFSNRTTSVKKYRSKNKVITAAKTPNRNPYRRKGERREEDTAQDKVPTSQQIQGNTVEAGSSDNTTGPQSVLISMLMAAFAQSQTQSDYVSAHLYWRTLQQLNTLTSDSLRRDGFATLLNIFSRGPRDSIRRSASAIEEYDAWLVWLKQSQERAEGLIDSMMKRLRSLRDKMWYVTAVRNSGPYESCKNIATALKTMGTPRKWDAHQKMQDMQRNLPRGTPTSYLLRAENQIVDLIAATEDKGGPNKLSDDQADKTARWLQQYGIENFCQGEERIHRFCCEVHTCISKLIGEGMMEAPVLWSSDLYSRETRRFEVSQPTRERESRIWDDSSSVISDPDRRFSSSRPGSTVRDLRAISTHNTSQQSLDSGRYSFSKASTALSDILDGPDYFAASSPVPTIDTATTYWSPFQVAMSPGSTTSRAHSPTTSITNLSGSFAYPGRTHLPSQSHYSTGRPGTSASSNETVYQQRVSEEKARFLNELSQMLTSLLLSDLGNLVFAHGSETDNWFGDLGQVCIERRETIGRHARATSTKEKRNSNRSSLKDRVIEKKRSFSDLRGATGERSPSNPDTPGSRGNDSSATSDTMTAKEKPSRKDTTPEFPFTGAFRRLLRMFCVHPNPYAKLNALHELEHLIVASLSSGGSKRKLAWMSRPDFGPTTGAEHHGTTTLRAKPLEETIDNVKERRSHAMVGLQSLTSPISPTRGGAANPETRSIMSVNPANTDAISNVLQSLFRDPMIRPKTLFRDLQYIASFVLPSVLDTQDRGKSFWNTGLAALSLKDEVCRTMVEVADEIVGHYTNTRKDTKTAARPPTSAPAPAGSSSTDAQDPALPSSPPAPSFSLADAARMWTITAKEGDPTSQRELALFYLSNPELVDRTTLPLSKPREVFKQTIMDKYSGSGSGSTGRYHAGSGASTSRPGTSIGGNGLGISSGPGPGAKVGDVRSDPALMCVAIHWIEAAERGGDELARRFLEQNEIVGLG